MCDLATGLPQGIRNASEQPVIYCRKPWHGHRETRAPANNPSAQPAQHILSSSRKSLLCHSQNPSLLPPPQSVAARRSMGHSSPSDRLWVPVSVRAELSCGPALQRCRGLRGSLSLACIFLHHQICVFKSSHTQMSTKKSTTQH